MMKWKFMNTFKSFFLNKRKHFFDQGHSHVYILPHVASRPNIYFAPTLLKKTQTF